MTDIIELAKKAGVIPHETNIAYMQGDFPRQLERFAALVLKAEADETRARFAQPERPEALAEPVKPSQLADASLEPVASPIMTKQEVKELSKKMWDELQDAAFAENTPKYWTYMVNNTWRNIDEQQPPEDAYDEGTLEPLYAEPLDAKAIRALKLVYDNSTSHDWPEDIWNAIVDALYEEHRKTMATAPQLLGG